MVFRTCRRAEAAYPRTAPDSDVLRGGVCPSRKSPTGSLFVVPNGGLSFDLPVGKSDAAVLRSVPADSAAVLAARTTTLVKAELS